MKNFGELKNDVGVLCQRSGDTDYLTKIGVWIQLSHKLLAEIYDYWIELQEKYNFVSVNGTEDYPLPNNFDKPLRIYDITNNKKLTVQTEEEYFDGNITNIIDVNKGVPSYARIFGTLGSRIAISSSGSTVQVKSSSASDTGSIKVLVQGYVDSALLIEDSEEIIISTGTPTTYVAGTKTFYKITQISKSANTVGYVTVSNSTGTMLDTLTPNERITRHKILKLGLIPDAVYSYRMLYKKTTKELVNDCDYPFTECDRYLILDALGWAFKQDTKDQQAEFVWKHAESALKVLLLNQNSKLGPDYQHRITSVWLEAHRKV